MSYKGVREPRPKHVVRSAHLAVSRFRALSRYIRPNDRILDIGSGGGEWLYLLKSQGLLPTGLDPDPAFAAFARRELAVDVFAGTLGDVRFAPHSFQVVTLFHVLEHLRDPVAALKQCLVYLADRGYLIVEVPNLASPHQHPQKRFHPAHLFGFVPATLALAARKAGGHLLELRTSSFSRNITVVIRKSDRPAAVLTPSAEEVAGVLAAVKPRTMLRYYGSPVTLYRFALRMLQFGREQAAVWGKPHARQILNSIIPDGPSASWEAEHRGADRPESASPLRQR